MQQIILLIHVLVAMGLIGLVLIQHGKGAEIGAAFGSGASNTVFGAQGSTSFLVKLTATLAAIFFCTSLVLGFMATRQLKQAHVIGVPTQSAPAQNTTTIKKETNKNQGSKTSDN